MGRIHISDILCNILLCIAKPNGYDTYIRHYNIATHCNTLQSPICDLWWLRKRAPGLLLLLAPNPFIIAHFNSHRHYHFYHDVQSCVLWWGSKWRFWAQREAISLPPSLCSGFVFSVQCFHCIMWLWWGWNISMWPSLCLRFVIVFVFSVSIAFYDYDEDENEDRDFQRTRSHFRATIFLFRMLVSVAPYLPHSYGHILILTWWGTHFSCVSNLEVFGFKGVI